MKFSATTAVASAGLLLTHTATAIFTSHTDLTLYWGQNSFGASDSRAQQNLSTYCANANVNIIPMAFVTKMTSGEGGQPVVNFANSGYNCTVFPGTNLWDCPTYAQDLKTCQQTYGKTILLSIGGATYNEGGFTSQTQATNTANLIWNTFGPQNNASGALRPFHDAVVDGFDLDIEEKNAYFRAFALRLRTLMNADTSKKYYLTAAPQCPYPDYMDPMFNNPDGGVPFDAIFVQYYNNAACGLQTYNASATTQAKFNFKTWNTFATTKSANKNLKVFLGIPGGPTGGTGYMTPAQLKPIVNYCKTFSNFGGISVWDASQAYQNGLFLKGVKALLTTTSSKRSAWSRVMRRQMVEEEVEEIEG